MHRWLLLLMIALLPLRSWVGDAMAGDMMVQHLAATAQTAQAAHDCPGHAAASDAQTPPAHETALPADCANCASCQVCSSVALALPVHRLPALPFLQPRPTGPAAVHASAERIQAFKPPIS
jgi:hypothetical protein